tara:strand:+ start:1786 stop:2145 length:360 start_codon:yes stop_codon:yes gene_type:complete
MPKIPDGEMNVSELRNLARQHNKFSMIKGIDTMSRKALMAVFKTKGYDVDHKKKKIIRMRKPDGFKNLKVGSKGLVKSTVKTQAAGKARQKVARQKKAIKSLGPQTKTKSRLADNEEEI